MCQVFEDSGFQMKAVLRHMFNSQWFKDARYQKIKSPAEVVAGTLRMVGLFENPDPGVLNIGKEPTYMGQSILDPPSVEGWHTGLEWINSGALLARINFVADRVSDPELPGMRDIIDRMRNEGVETPDHMLDACTEYMGFIELSEETRGQLAEHVRAGGNVNWDDRVAAATRIGETMALISATTEYQFG